MTFKQKISLSGEQKLFANFVMEAFKKQPFQTSFATQRKGNAATIIIRRHFGKLRQNIPKFFSVFFLHNGIFEGRKDHFISDGYVQLTIGNVTFDEDIPFNTVQYIHRRFQFPFFPNVNNELLILTKEEFLISASRNLFGFVRRLNLQCFFVVFLFFFNKTKRHFRVRHKALQLTSSAVTVCQPRLSKPNLNLRYPKLYPKLTYHDNPS